jgi:hypothetical protein
MASGTKGAAERLPASPARAGSGDGVAHNAIVDSRTSRKRIMGRAYRNPDGAVFTCLSNRVDKCLIAKIPSSSLPAP